MRIRSINPGDIVRVNVRGRLFHAHVRAAGHDGLTVEPIERGVSYRTVRAHQIVDHWAHEVTTRREDRPPPGQVALDV